MKSHSDLWYNWLLRIPDCFGCIVLCPRSAMTRAMDVGQTLLDFSRMYYEDHVKPTTDKYIELASDTTNSMWERISNKWTEYYEN